MHSNDVTVSTTNTVTTCVLNSPASNITCVVSSPVLTSTTTVSSCKSTPFVLSCNILTSYKSASCLFSTPTSVGTIANTSRTCSITYMTQNPLSASRINSSNLTVPTYTETTMFPVSTPTQAATLTSSSLSTQPQHLLPSSSVYSPSTWSPLPVSVMDSSQHFTPEIKVPTTVGESLPKPILPKIRANSLSSLPSTRVNLHVWSIQQYSKIS